MAYTNNTPKTNRFRVRYSASITKFDDLTNFYGGGISIMNFSIEENVPHDADPVVYLSNRLREELERHFKHVNIEVAD